jgi:hypothetical protein
MPIGGYGTTTPPARCARPLDGLRLRRLPGPVREGSPGRPGAAPLLMGCPGELPLEVLSMGSLAEEMSALLGHERKALGSSGERLNTWST